MKPRERFLKAIRLKKVDRPPVLSPNQTATVEQMESLDIYFPEANESAEKMARLASAAWEHVGLEGIGVPFCQTIEAEIFGVEVNWSRRKTDIPESPFIGHSTPEGIEVPEDFLERGRVPVVLEAIELLREWYGGELPILGHVIGPFSLAAHLATMEKILKMSIENPRVVGEFTKLGLDAIADYANAMLERGADAIVVENMFASVDIVGDRRYVECAQPFDRELIDKIRGDTVLHICGDCTKIIDKMVDTGVTSLSIDVRTDAEQAVQASRGKASVMGNVDTEYTLSFGTAEEVVADTRRALEAGFDVIAPGCAISPITPNENIRAMVETVRKSA